MSQNQKINPVANDMDFSVLDRELACMAAETPAMPADFHAGWVQKVRETAAESTERSSAESSPKKGNSRKQWRYLISTAAVFVLVIGSILLPRILNRTSTEPTGETDTVQQDVGNEANDALKAEEIDIPAMEEEEAFEAEPAYEMTAMEDSSDAAAGGMVAAEPSGMMKAASEARSEDSGDWDTNAEEMDAEEANGGFFAAASYTASADTAVEDADVMMAEPAADTGMAAQADNIMAAAMTAAPTVAATDEAVATAELVITAEPTISATAEPASDTEAAADLAAAKNGDADSQTAEKPEESVEENHSFLQKLWDGLLTAAPWILGGVIVVLFITSVIFRIGKKKS